TSKTDGWIPTGELPAAVMEIPRIRPEGSLMEVVPMETGQIDQMCRVYRIRRTNPEIKLLLKTGNWQKKSLNLPRHTTHRSRHQGKKAQAVLSSPSQMPYPSPGR